MNVSCLLYNGVLLTPNPLDTYQLQLHNPRQVLMKYCWKCQSALVVILSPSFLTVPLLDSNLVMML